MRLFSVGDAAVGRHHLPTIGSSVGWVAGARVGALGCNLLTGVVIARALVPSARGSLAVMIAISAVGALCMTAGLDSATLRISGAGGVTAALRATITRTAIVTGLAAIYAAGALLAPSGSIFGLTPGEAAVAVIPMPFIVANQLLGNCLIGIQRPRRWSAISVANAGIFAGLAALAAGIGWRTPIAFALGLAISYLATAAAMWRELGPYRGRPDPAAVRQLRTTARATAPSTLSQLAMLRVQAPLLQTLASSAAVGVLAIATPISEALLLIPVAAGTVLLPAYARNEAPPSVVRKHALTLGLATTACAGVLAGGAWLLIPTIYGAEYAGARKLVLIMIPGLLLFAVARVFQSHMFATGQFRRVAAAALLGLSVSVGVQLLLSPELGATGAAVAISVGYASAAVAMVPFGLLVGVREPGRGVKTAMSRGDGRRTVLPVVLAAFLLAVVVVLRLPLVLVAVALVALAIPLLLVAANRIEYGILAGLLVSLAYSGSHGLLAYAALLPLIVALFVRLLDRGGERLAGRPSGRMWPIWMAALITVVDATIYPTGRNAVLLATALLLFMLLVTAFVFRAVPYRQLSRAIVAAGAVGATAYLASAVPRVASGGVEAWASARGGGAWLNPNAAGLFFLICLAVPMGDLVVGRRPVLPNLCTVVLLVSAVAFTFSRSSYLGLLFEVAVFCVFLGRRALWAVLPLAWFATHLPGSVVERIQYTTASGRLDASSAVRLQLWSDAWHVAATHPLLGVGLPSVGQQVSRDLTGGQFAFAHNSYLTAIAAWGLVFPVIVLVAALRGLRRNLDGVLRAGRRTPQAVASLMACGAAAVCSVFGEPLLVPTVGVLLVALLSSAWAGGGRRTDARVADIRDGRRRELVR